MSTAETTRISAEGLVSSFDRCAFSTATALRKESLELLTATGFPGNKHEEYRFTPIAKQVEKILSEIDISAPDSQSSVDIAPYLLPGYQANVIVFVNGRFDAAQSRLISPENQIRIVRLEDALRDTPDQVLPHLGQYVDFKADAFAAFNTAFWRDGLFVEVPANTTVEKPIYILHLHTADSQPVVGTTRLLMMVGAESRVHLIERFESIGSHPVFSSWVEEIVIKEKAQLEYCKIQNDPGQLYQIASTRIHQHNGSQVNTYTFTSNGKIVRNNFEIAIDGERCESHFHGLYLITKDTLADNHTVVDHRKPNSFSNELYKGVLDGNSRGIFNGKIFVRPHAQKTNAFQANKNVLLNDSAVIHTKPQLEIWADDVKCSHGCTSGQLDDEALFYLQSRGISRDQARAMLLNAFAAEVLETMKDEILKSYLEGIISERLQKIQ